MMSINCIKLGMLTGIFLLLNMTALAQKGIGDSTGIAREFEQPELKSIEGTLDRIKTGPCEHATGYAYIGTHLFIKAGETDQLLNVHLGAAYAVEMFVNGLETGDYITGIPYR